MITIRDLRKVPSDRFWCSGTDGESIVTACDRSILDVAAAAAGAADSAGVGNDP